MTRSVCRVATAALSLTLALAIAGCGDPTPAETATPEETAPPQETASPSEDPTDSETVEPSGEHGVGGIDPVPDAELPGEEVVTYFSGAGTEVDVVGVEADDVLFVRATPDPAADEVGRLAPTGSIGLTGRERLVDSGIWTEVQLSDGVGWASTTYLGFLGLGTDVTQDLSSSTEAGATGVEELALEIGSFWASRAEENDQTHPVISSIGEDAGGTEDLVRVDVLPYPDDSLYGERLELILDSSGGVVLLTQAIAVPICSRGVSEGLCL